MIGGWVFVYKLGRWLSMRLAPFVCDVGWWLRGMADRACGETVVAVRVGDDR